MAAVIYPPATPFGVPHDHPNVHAHRWLDAVLAELDWGFEANYYGWVAQQKAALAARMNELPHAMQIAILKACLERMPWHRQRSFSETELSVDFYIGSLLYEMACALYKRRLPYSEDDICQILGQSRHTCGHGSDVTPPFEIAIAFARTHGLSSDLLCALKEFIKGLKSVRSAQAFNLKRKSGLLFVLDSAATVNEKRCWSERFRAGLLAIPPEEQARWRRLVLGMAMNDKYLVPKAWRRQAARFVEELGPQLIVDRLSAWLPDPKEKTLWPIQTGGSHLLKHFIWLLGLSGKVGGLEPKCVELVSRLSEIDWKPRERAQKAVIAAASFLVSFSPDVSWLALQRLAQWSASAPCGAKGDKIPELLRKYCRDHRLKLPEAVQPGERQ